MRSEVLREYDIELLNWLHYQQPMGLGESLVRNNWLSFR